MHVGPAIMSTCHLRGDKKNIGYIKAALTKIFIRKILCLKVEKETLICN